MSYQQILKDSNYNLDLFTEAEIGAFERNISTREVKGKLTYYAPCLIRGKEIKLKPEEVVRQLYLNRLLNEYRYPKHSIAVERPVMIPSETKSSPSAAWRRRLRRTSGRR